jgi:putative hydrolase of the HAD superfamily
VRDPERFGDPQLKVRRGALTLAHQRGEVTCADYFAGVAASTDGLYSAEEIERVHNAWLLDEYAGVYRLIEDLNAAGGVRTVCLSNTNEYHWRRGLLESGRYPAIGSMRAHYVSHEMGLVKPDGAIYSALEAREGIGGGRVVFFDDLEENIAAACGVGWGAHRVDFAGEPAEQMRGVLEGLGVISGP